MSGLNQQQNPIFYSVFYDYHAHITICASSILCLLMVYSLNINSYQYQLNVYASCFMITLFSSGILIGQAQALHYGRFWYLFPMATVVYNDAMAFFAGSMFGRTKLIRLSPNKTWEGFIGGFIFNLISTWVSINR
jgi:phosphatidate cytidylyltransferase